MVRFCGLCCCGTKDTDTVPLSVCLLSSYWVKPLAALWSGLLLFAMGFFLQN